VAFLSLARKTLGQNVRLCSYHYYTMFQTNYLLPFCPSLLHILLFSSSSFFIWVLQHPVGQGLLSHEVFLLHTTTHQIWYDSSGRVISCSQRPLPDNTQHSQQTNIHAHGGIRTHNLSRRATADLHFRPCGQWDRQAVIKNIIYICIYIHIL
jgi:hypothetical protein